MEQRPAYEPPYVFHYLRRTDEACDLVPSMSWKIRFDVKHVTHKPTLESTDVAIENPGMLSMTCQDTRPNYKLPCSEVRSLGRYYLKCPREMQAHLSLEHPIYDSESDTTVRPGPDEISGESTSLINGLTELIEDRIRRPDWTEFDAQYHGPSPWGSIIDEPQYWTYPQRPNYVVYKGRCAYPEELLYMDLQPGISDCMKLYIKRNLDVSIDVESSEPADSSDDEPPHLRDAVAHHHRRMSSQNLDVTRILSRSTSKKLIDDQMSHARISRTVGGTYSICASTGPYSPRMRLSVVRTESRRDIDTDESDT